MVVPAVQFLLTAAAGSPRGHFSPGGMGGARLILILHGARGAFCKAASSGITFHYSLFTKINHGEQ